MLRVRYILLLAMFKYPKDTHIHMYTRTCTKYILKVRNCWVDWLSNFISLLINTVLHEVIYFGLHNFNSISIFLINYVGVECHCQREGTKIRKLGVQCQCKLSHAGGDLETVKSIVSEPLWATACGPPLPPPSLQRVLFLLALSHLKAFCVQLFLSHCSSCFLIQTTSLPTVAQWPPQFK